MNLMRIPIHCFLTSILKRVGRLGSLSKNKMILKKLRRHSLNFTVKKYRYNEIGLDSDVQWQLEQTLRE
jgi:hypothetical protein